MRPRSLLATFLSVLAFGLAKPMTEASANNEPTAFLYTVAKHYEPLAWMKGADRFASGAIIFVNDTVGRHPLVPSFAASADPAVSFDGERVLFAGKQKASEPWQVWEMPLGGEPRRVTSGPEDCIRPFYLPGNHLVYARRTAGRFEIEAMDLAGGKPLPLTYGPASFLPTDVLRDGRILFEAGHPLASEDTAELYTVYPDGSGLESYRCDHGPARHLGKQVKSGDIVFATSAGLARFTSARAQEDSIAAPAGDYAGDVAEVPSGDWLLPWRPNRKSRFQLEIWRPGTAAHHMSVAERDADVIQPVMLGGAITPKRFPSGLHDWPNANLLCLNAYTSKYQFPAGAIHSVRVYARDGEGGTRLLGTAPVESDGSFFVQVPTEQALQIELLDASGRTLKRQAGYFWMRRGEQRVCVGCHAGPETAPENAVPKILLRSTTPADMTGTTMRDPSGGQ